MVNVLGVPVESSTGSTGSTGSTETPGTLPTEQELTTATTPEVTTPPPPETPGTLSTQQELTTATEPKVTTPPPESTATLRPSNATTAMVMRTTTAATTTTAVGPFQSTNETAATDMVWQAVRTAINQLLVLFGVNTVPQNMKIDLSELVGQGIIVKSSGWTMGEGRVVSGAVTDICEAETCSLYQGLPVGFGPFLVGPVKVSVINGPALSMGQWRTIADNMYNMLSINNNVFFEGYITVTDDS